MTVEELTSHEIERDMQAALNKGDERLLLYLMWSRHALNHFLGWSL